MPGLDAMTVAESFKTGNVGFNTGGVDGDAI